MEVRAIPSSNQGSPQAERLWGEGFALVQHLLALFFF